MLPQVYRSPSPSCCIVRPAVLRISVAFGECARDGVRIPCCRLNHSWSGWQRLGTRLVKYRLSRGCPKSTLNWRCRLPETTRTITEPMTVASHPHVVVRASVS
ncbi:hypothetical protein M407DRAFT_125878 [Tulasnella calospora MUT 4182]|uniref:Uncharacterized protein n=1 Tax=Tulasnella calospora MUT 4182 TaxID=1051891 RepID=A0A0C3QB00_9AGAM|nr:hypothetical protein M407DRAFT_125878 [Tulasnella calospora MUT 4182]